MSEGNRGVELVEGDECAGYGIERLLGISTPAVKRSEKHEPPASAPIGDARAPGLNVCSAPSSQGGR